MSPEDVTREVRRLEITTRHLVRDIVAGEYSSAFRGRGVEFAHAPEKTYWGYGAELKDPDGYLVRLWDERSMKDK